MQKDMCVDMDFSFLEGHRFFKVGLSLSKKVSLICFNESPLKG